MISLENETLIVEAIDAGHGDALLVRYYRENGDIPVILLVDGGPSSARNPKRETFNPYKDRVIPWLREVRENLEAEGRLGARANDPNVVLDLVVCTHIDDDHIAGIDRLYDCLANQEKCAPGGDAIEARQLWFNSFSAMLKGIDIVDAVSDQPVTVVQGVAQGERVTVNAPKHGATINAGAPGGLIAGLHIWDKRFAPAKITVLNPDRKALENLAKDWRKEMAKVKTEVQTSALEGRFPVDRAVPNLSSIVMVVECFGRSVLLTGDQLSKNILPALDKAYPDRQGKHRFDVVKVPHHGSIANVQREFVERVQADVYVFCANGKDQNPDPPTLELFAQAAGPDRRFTMAFTTGGLVYDKAGKKDEPKLPPKLGADSVETLDQALAVLRMRYPDFREYVTVVKRDPDSHALGFGLKKTGGIDIAGAL
ncbi:MAG TPA: MBL fold metallo-hydrolase [Rhabdaerophilum sp.]|nr:MBL fold metallo-hydrolase [Rhabdaerophilum sp.]